MPEETLPEENIPEISEFARFMGSCIDELKKTDIQNEELYNELKIGFKYQDEQLLGAIIALHAKNKEYDKDYRLIPVLYKVVYYAKEKANADLETTKKFGDPLRSIILPSYLKKAIEAEDARLLEALFSNKRAKSGLLEHISLDYYLKIVISDNAEILATLFKNDVGEKVLREHDSPFRKTQGGLIKLIIDNNATKCMKVYCQYELSGLNKLIGNVNGDNALLYAIRTGKTEMASYLIDSGMNCAFQNNDGETALHLAVKSNQPDLVRKLLALGVPRHTKEVIGQKTAFQYAAEIKDETAREEMSSIFKENKAEDHSLMTKLKKESPFFKKMIAQKRTVTPDTKMFAHLNTGYTMGSTELEGESLTNTTAYYADLLNRIPLPDGLNEKEIQKITDILTEIHDCSIEINKVLRDGNFKTGHDRNEIEIQLVNKFRDILLQKKSLWLPGGYANKGEPGHAMVYHLAIKDDTVYFKLYNTGDGARYHLAKEGKRHAIKTFKFPLKEHAQLDTLLSNILYYQLDSYWDAKKIDSEMLYKELLGTKLDLYSFTTLPARIKGDGIVFYKRENSEQAYYYVKKDGKVVVKDKRLPEDWHYDADNTPLDIATLEVDENHKVINPHAVEKASYAYDEINKKHNGCLGRLYAEEILPKSDHTLMTDQKGGNCTAKVLQSGLLKDLIPNDMQYQHVKLMLRLQSTVDYLAGSIESGAINNVEVQQEIEDGIKKTALLLNEMKDVFKLEKTEYLEILNGLEIIVNELKEIKKQELTSKQPSHEKFPEPATLEFKTVNLDVIRDMSGERRSIEPHEIKYIFDSKINHFSNMHLLKAFVDQQKKNHVPQYVIKQNIASALKALPYDLLRKYDYSNENLADFWCLGDKDFIKQLEDLKSIINIYNENLEENFSPKDTMVNEQLLFMLEHTRHVFETRNHITSRNGHVSDILSINFEGKSKDLNISPGNSIFLEGVTHLVSDFGSHGNTHAFHLIAREVEKDKTIMKGLETEAFEYALKKAKQDKLLQDKDLEKIKGIDDVERPLVLVCGYIGQKENFKKFEHTELNDKTQQSQNTFQLSEKASHNMNFFKHYYDSLEQLSQGLLMGNAGGFLSRQNAIVNTLGIGFVNVQQDKNRENKSLLSISGTHLNSYQYRDSQKEINVTLQYNQSKGFFAKKENFLSDLNYDEYKAEDSEPEPNVVQVATAVGSAKKEKTKLREISHLRTQSELKFIKTVDYITKNMDKLLDPSYFRMIRICLLNSNSLDVAKTTMPEAMMSFFELVSHFIKRYANKAHVDEKAIKMISLFSILANYIEKEDNPMFIKACDDIRSELVLLIEHYNPALKKFKGPIEATQAHETMGALYQLWLISLGNKESLNNAELEMYIRAKIYLSKFPRKPDDPLHAKFLNVTTYKAIKAFSEMDPDKLGIMLEKSGISGAKETKWRLAGGQFVDSNNRIFDLESGAVKMGTSALAVMPAQAFQNKSFTSLLPDISVSHPAEMYSIHFKLSNVYEYDISCTEFEYQGEKYRYTDTDAFQKQFKVKSPYDNWWQLQSRPDNFMKHFPKVLWDADHDIWANCKKEHSLLISSNKGKDPACFFDDGKLYKIKNNEVTDYVLLASDSPHSLLEPLTRFEDPDYCLIWQSKTRTPNIIVEMPRYHLTFTADKATKPLVLRCEAYPGYTLDLSNTNNIGVYFDNYLTLTPDKDNQSQKCKILVPNQPFVLPSKRPATDIHRIKFRPLKLDVSSSVLDAKNQLRTLGPRYLDSDFEPIKHSPPEHYYTASQMLTEFELENNRLVAKSKGDLLQAIYLYIGNNDYTQAYRLTEQYIKEGGFTGSPKEIRLMNWIVHDIPHNFYHPKDPRSANTALLKYTHPTLIAIKLKLLAQVSKFSNVGIPLHLSEEQQQQLKIPDWEFESLNGEKGNQEALGVTEIRVLSEKWLQLYNKQKNNIPVEMHLTSLEDVNLRNLNAPKATKVVLEKTTLPKQKMEIQVSLSKPKSILEHCDSVGVKFDFKSLKAQNVKTEAVFETPDNATDFEKKLIAQENEDCHYAKKMQAQRAARQLDILHKLGHEGAFLKLIDTVSTETDRLSTELRKEKEAILALANKVLNLDENRLSLLSGQTKRMTIADLNKLLVKGDLSEYQSITRLSDEEINTLKQMHINYLAKKSQEKINKNFLKLCEKTKKSQQFKDFEAIIPELNKWYFKDRVYDIEKHPEFLIFEATQGLLIDEKQFHILSTLSKVENDVFTSMVTQLIMGGGKSKVLLPLLALLKAKGNNLSIIVVPDALLQTNFQDLASVSKSIFNQDIYRFSFTRQANYSEEQLLTKLNQLKIIRDNRSFIVMNKTSLEDLELKLAEMMKHKHPKDQKSIEIMKQMLSMFRNEGDALIDEMHLVHDIKIERNFTVADGTVKMKPEYVHSCLQLYDFFETIPYKDNQSLFEYISGENASFTEEDLKVLLPNIISALYTNPNSPIADFLKKYQDKFTEKQLEEFLTAKSHLLFLDELKDEEIQKLYIIKELLSNLLPLNLRRNPLEHYGPTKRPEELKHLEGSIVKPCRNVGKVNEDSKFSSPYETLDYTVLYSLKFGIQEQVFRAYLAKVKKAVLQEHELSLNSIPIAETEAAKAFESLTGLSPDVLQLNLQDKDIASLHQQCHKNPEFVLHCLEEHVLPLIDVDTLLLKHNAINHAFQFRSVQGFSGTIITPDIFDPRMESFDYEFAKGTDGETISHVVAKQSPVENIKSENIDDILQQLMLSITPKTSSIIDVGGILKGKEDVLEYVKPLAEHFKQNRENNTVSKDIKYILFFDEHDVLCAYPIYDQTPKVISIGSTDPDIIKDKLNIQDPGGYFSLYFQDYTVGIDIKQITDGEGLVTVGNSSTLAKFLQGLMRMRGFALNQKIKIFVDKQAQDDMAEDDSKGTKKGHYDYQDVLNYTFKKQIQKIAEDNVAATRCMLRNVIRNQAVLLILASPENDYSKFEAFQSLLFDESPTEPSKLFRGFKKLENTESDFKLLKANLLKQFETLSASVIQEEALKKMMKDLEEDMDAIIKKQVPKCQPELYTAASSNYDTQTISEKAVMQEKKSEQKMEQQQELENQNTASLVKHEPLPYIPWSEYVFVCDWSVTREQTVTVDTVQVPLFSKINDLLPLEKTGGNLFSDNLYASPNLLYSVKNQRSAPLDNLKKPVEFVLWMEMENNQYRAIMMTGDEFLEIQRLNPNLKNAWVESVGGIQAMGKPPAKLQDNYYKLKTDMALYNCDFEYLILNRSLHAPLLEQSNEKLKFIRDHVLPLHPERMSTWNFFERFVDHLHTKKSLSQKEEVQPIQPVVFTDLRVKQKTGEQDSKLSKQENQPPNRLTFTNLHAKHKKPNKPSSKAPPTIY